VRLAAVLLVAILVSVPAPALVFANEAVPTELDRVQQKRAMDLAEHLRCLVCQNQTIADSNAELAQDLRRQVREQIAQGRSDSEIVSFMVQRYGDFVLYKPPMKATTLLLWFGPGLLLLVGVVMLFRNVRARSKGARPVALTEEEHAKAAALLNKGSAKDIA
jgi:cytochrome c-type biogenesis protein CcmH